MDNNVVKVVSHDSGILHLSLNRPDQLNALSQATLQALLALFSKAKQDATVKALLISGEGKAFCAGADIKELAALNGPEGLSFARFGQHVFRSLEMLGKPSLAAIQGYALGGGCELAMAATMRIAAKTAVFSQPEIKLGVIPGFGGTQRLARLVGKGRALALCLTGRRFSADEAHAWGMLSELTSPDNLLQRAKDILIELSQMGAVALESVMAAIHFGYGLPLEEALEIEASQFGLCCATEDKNEGVRAFIDKRRAIFSGK